MTVQNTIPYEKYITNGSDSIYTLSYYVEDKDNLLIKLNDTVVSKNEYSYIKSSNAVQFNTTLSANQKLEIFRKTKLERTTNYESFNNTFRPEVLNNDLDKIWLNLQEQSHKVDQYDFNYEYVVHTSTQALTEVVTAQARADQAYELADLTNTETRSIERGGTGAIDKATARSNLEIYSQTETDNLLNTKLTANNNLSDLQDTAIARTNLDVHNKAEVLALVQTGGTGTTLAVDGGGTGATTATEARTNLDVYSKAEVNTAITTSVPIVADATTTDKGIVRLATESDITNSSESVALTPKNVNDMLIGVGASAKGYRALFSTRLTEMVGTNTSTGTTITATITAHGLSVGDVILVNYRYYFFSNQQASDIVVVTSVTNANTFVFTSPRSATGSSTGGTCTVSYAIKSKYNINSLTINAVGRYTIAINTASGITGTNFIPLVSATTADNSVIVTQPEVITSATSLTVRTFDKTGVAITPQWLHIGVTQ